MMMYNPKQNFEVIFKYIDYKQPGHLSLKIKNIYFTSYQLTKKYYMYNTIFRFFKGLNNNQAKIFGKPVLEKRRKL